MTVALALAEVRPVLRYGLSGDNAEKWNRRWAVERRAALLVGAPASEHLPGQHARGFRG
jgi:hypothetical protein